MPTMDIIAIPPPTCCVEEAVSPRSGLHAAVLACWYMIQSLGMNPAALLALGQPTSMHQWRRLCCNELHHSMHPCCGCSCCCCCWCVMQDALQAGHPFATSTNGVLLTPGPLPVRFVRLVSPDDMPPDWWAVLGEPPAASS